MKAYYTDDTARVFCCDAFDLLKHLPDACIDLIVTDPPYFRVKDEWWDNQWDNADRFVEWIGQISREFQRVLRPNGSLYLFASSKMSARVECKIGEFFNILNSIRWVKHEGWHKKIEKKQMRSFFPASESIIFAEHFSSDSMARGESGYNRKCDELRGFVFNPIRLYLRGEWKRAGLTAKDANRACGTSSMAGNHYFSKSQWCLPTEEHYIALQQYANAHGKKPPPPCDQYHAASHSRFSCNCAYLQAEYEDLRAEYEDLRRPFSVTKDVPYIDVWDFPFVKARPGRHPCEKPESLIAHIIKTSSRKNAVVADFFMGSGVVWNVSQKLKKQFIGCDISEKWCRVSVEKIAHQGKISF